MNGPITQATLLGLPDANEAAKAKVGPTFLPSFVYGAYWIIEAGTFENLEDGTYASSTDDQYDWALISGGPPKVETPHGCSPGTGENNYNGLWMFSRDPLPASGVSDKIERIAAEKGFDITLWEPIVQEGCIFER